MLDHPNMIVLVLHRVKNEMQSSQSCLLQEEIIIR